MSPISTSFTLPLLFKVKKSKKRNFAVFLTLLIQIIFTIFLISDIVVFSREIELNSIVNYTITKVVLILIGIMLNFAVITPLINSILKATQLKENNSEDFLKSNKQGNKCLMAQLWINTIWKSIYLILLPIPFLILRGLALDSTQKFIISFSCLMLIRLMVFDYIIFPLAHNVKHKEGNEVKYGNVLNYLWINLTVISLYITFVICSYVNILLIRNTGIISLIALITIPTSVFILIYISKVIAIYLINRKNINKYVNISALLIWISKPN
ncbi:hypothetical protein [Mycoplasma phocoeninasale]|uniref:hypothetical protein n=1 Tax=Mycoplasma phocoeninasale TaxID=2726117 RepID=UPI001967B8DC|nr:hypothetical protein [Mycoplasma phocoeninasale]MBN0970505.1 hypothetical protein [Mycoplasma phocoeninasale]